MARSARRLRLRNRSPAAKFDLTCFVVNGIDFAITDIGATILATKVMSVN